MTDGLSCPYDVCPMCGEEIDLGSVRFNGRRWEHKSREAHPQAGHHVLPDKEQLDEAPDAARNTDSEQFEPLTIKSFEPQEDSDEGEWCEDCERHVSTEHWDYLCHCDEPTEGRTLAKGTPAERTHCGNCGKKLREEQ